MKGTLLMGNSHIVTCGKGRINYTALKFRNSIKFESSCICNLLLLYLYNHRWKQIIYQLRKSLKIYEINQRLKDQL